jgi:hypothetical protein
VEGQQPARLWLAVVIRECYQLPVGMLDTVVPGLTRPGVRFPEQPDPKPVTRRFDDGGEGDVASIIDDHDFERLRGIVLPGKAREAAAQTGRPVSGRDDYRAGNAVHEFTHDRLVLAMRFTRC